LKNLGNIQIVSENHGSQPKRLKAKKIHIRQGLFKVHNQVFWIPDFRKLFVMDAENILV